MRANPKNLRLHLLAEEDALVQTDDGDGIFAPANRDPDGQGHTEFTQTNLVSDLPGLAVSMDPNLVNHWGIAFGATSPLNLVQSAASLGANAQGAGSVTASEHRSRFELVPKIAITSTRDNPTGNPFLTAEIYLIDPDGTNPQRLTNNTYGDGFPMLSPDGKEIVFDSNRLTLDLKTPFGVPNTSDLFVMELTPRVYSAEATGFLPGIEQTLLTRGSSATWSPDSKNIAFHASASYYASGGTVTGIPTRSDPGAATTDSDLFGPRSRPGRSDQNPASDQHHQHP
jgi:hypothetical protein